MRYIFCIAEHADNTAENGSHFWNAVLTKCDVTIHSSKSGEIQMSKYLFFDMDGTLISPITRHIPESAIKGIQKAMAAGHKCFLCTGRSYRLGLEYDDELHLPGMVFCNGAGLAYEGEILETEDIDSELVYRMMEITDYLGGDYSLLTRNFMYKNEKSYLHSARNWGSRYTNESTEEIFARRGVRFMGDYHGEAVQKIDIYFTSQMIADIFFSRVPDSLQLVRAGGYYSGTGDRGGEITKAGVNKGTGVRKVIERFGGTLDDCYGFGDSSNDIEMMKTCGHSIAMGNGSEAVKDLAEVVTDSVDDNGICNALVHFGLI